MYSPEACRRMTCREESSISLLSRAVEKPDPRHADDVATSPRPFTDKECTVIVRLKRRYVDRSSKDDAGRGGGRTAKPCFVTNIGAAEEDTDGASPRTSTVMSLSPSAPLLYGSQARWFRKYERDGGLDFAENAATRNWSHVWRNAGEEGSDPSSRDVK